MLGSWLKYDGELRCQNILGKNNTLLIFGNVYNCLIDLCVLIYLEVLFLDKSVFVVGNQVILKPACSATETSLTLWILHVACFEATIYFGLQIIPWYKNI